MDRELVARELLLAARDLMAIYGLKMPRDFYAPKGVKPETFPGVDVEAYSYEKNGIPYAAFFVGKQSAPIWHYRFRSEQDRRRAIDEAVRNRKSQLESKQQRQTERSQYQHDLKEGDILYGSWGYDQTNVDFYQVVQVKDKSVVIRKVEGRTVKEERGADYVAAVPGKFTGPPMVKRVGPGGRVRIESYLSVSKWDGRPKYQTAFGFGH
jgi:hypothetical protein